MWRTALDNAPRTQLTEFHIKYLVSPFPLNVNLIIHGAMQPRYRRKTSAMRDT